MIFFFFIRRSLLSKSSSGQDVVFVKFENDTSDVELVNEDRRLQRKTSFDNPTYGAVENLSQSQVSGILEKIFEKS